jgi:hypothetical protein
MADAILSIGVHAGQVMCSENTGKQEEMRMDILARRAFLEGFLGSERTTMKTDLYRLFDAIQEEVSPGEDELVVAVVSHLLDTGRIRVPMLSALAEDYSNTGMRVT